MIFNELLTGVNLTSRSITNGAVIKKMILENFKNFSSKTIDKIVEGQTNDAFKRIQKLVYFDQVLYPMFIEMSSNMALDLKKEESLNTLVENDEYRKYVALYSAIDKDLKSMRDGFLTNLDLFSEVVILPMLSQSELHEAVGKMENQEVAKKWALPKAPLAEETMEVYNPEHIIADLFRAIEKNSALSKKLISSDQLNTILLQTSIIGVTLDHVVEAGKWKENEDDENQPNISKADLVTSFLDAVVKLLLAEDMNMDTFVKVSRIPTSSLQYSQLIRDIGEEAIKNASIEKLGFKLKDTIESLPGGVTQLRLFEAQVLEAIELDKTTISSLAYKRDELFTKGLTEARSSAMAQYSYYKNMVYAPIADTRYSCESSVTQIKKGTVSISSNKNLSLLSHPIRMAKNTDTAVLGINKMLDKLYSFTINANDVISRIKELYRLTDVTEDKLSFEFNRDRLWEESNYDERLLIEGQVGETIRLSELVPGQHYTVDTDVVLAHVSSYTTSTDISLVGRQLVSSVKTVRFPTTKSGVSLYIGQLDYSLVAKQVEPLFSLISDEMSRGLKQYMPEVVSSVDFTFAYVNDKLRKQVQFFEGIEKYKVSKSTLSLLGGLYSLRSVTPSDIEDTLTKLQRYDVKLNPQVIKYTEDFAKAVAAWLTEVFTQPFIKQVIKYLEGKMTDAEFAEHESGRFARFKDQLLQSIIPEGKFDIVSVIILNKVLGELKK